MAGGKRTARSTQKVVATSKIRLPYLYQAIGKLYAELCEADGALRPLDDELDEGMQTPDMREPYYRALRRRGEVKERLDASLQDLHSQANVTTPLTRFRRQKKAGRKRKLRQAGVS
jgi:hypothetical protein